MENAPNTVQVRALRRAAEILGGKDKLRAALRVPMSSLDQWLDGKVAPPMDVFLKAVDIISSPSGNYTPPPASVRARILTKQSNELIQHSRRTVAQARELRGESRSRASPKVSEFLEAVFGKN